jgi:protein transport protein SEC20
VTSQRAPLTAHHTPFIVVPDLKMSFESVLERLALLQESNAELRRSIERLATINFQPGSVPLDNEEDNVLDEMQADIQGLMKEQEEEFENLQEDVMDLNSGRECSELETRRNGLDRAVKRAVGELHRYVSCSVVLQENTR